MITKGTAEANVIQVQNEAEVAGLRMALSGFTSAQQFAQYHIIARLAPSLSEIFASDDSEFAKLFSSYMTAPPTARPMQTRPAALPTAGAAGPGRPPAKPPEPVAGAATELDR